MSSKYIKAEDYPYYFKTEPRELSVYDSLAFVDSFGYAVVGQPGIVLRTLADEVRRLNREIYATKVSDKTDAVAQSGASGLPNFLDTEPSIRQG